MGLFVQLHRAYNRQFNPNEVTMRFCRLLPAFFLLFALASFAQSAPSEKAVGFSIDNIDKTLDPCVDFYQYACGNWLKNTEIPADQSSWVSFTELDERNLVTLKDILEKASTGGPNRSAVDQKIGDFYGACMDEKTANAEGPGPAPAGTGPHRGSQRQGGADRCHRARAPDRPQPVVQFLFRI